MLQLTHQWDDSSLYVLQEWN